MDDTLHTALAGWNSFYVITGSAAAALTGLQFVVQTLITAGGNRVVAGDDAEATISAFGTPTVVHFSFALVLSCVLCAPWPTATGLREMLGGLGAGALVYSAVVLRRTRRQQGYAPVLEDWVFHVVLPGVAYGAVVLAALWLGGRTVGPLFVIAAATLVLICVGIHNAWDTVIYLSIGAIRTAGVGEERGPAQQVGKKRPAKSANKRSRHR